MLAPEQADPALSAAACKKLRLSLAADTAPLAMPTLDNVDRAQKRRRIERAAAAALEMGGDSGEGIEDAAAAPAECDSDSSSSSSSSSSPSTSSTSSSASTNVEASGSGSCGESSGDGAGGSQGEEESEREEVPATILGQAVALVRPKANQRGLKVFCNNPAHGPECCKYRSLKVDTAVHGPAAAALYLEAWLAASHEDLGMPHKR